MRKVRQSLAHRHVTLLLGKQHAPRQELSGFAGFELIARASATLGKGNAIRLEELATSPREQLPEWKKPWVLTVDQQGVISKEGGTGQPGLIMPSLNPHAMLKTIHTPKRLVDLASNTHYISSIAATNVANSV